jgi:hypothetical protein
MDEVVVEYRKTAVVVVLEKPTAKAALAPPRTVETDGSGFRTTSSMSPLTFLACSIV